MLKMEMSESLKYVVFSSKLVLSELSNDFYPSPTQRNSLRTFFNSMSTQATATALLNTLRDFLLHPHQTSLYSLFSTGRPGGRRVIRGRSFILWLRTISTLLKLSNQWQGTIPSWIIVRMGTCWCYEMTEVEKLAYVSGSSARPIMTVLASAC